MEVTEAVAIDHGLKKDILELHIAHNEGNYFCSDDELKS